MSQLTHPFKPKKRHGRKRSCSRSPSPARVLHFEHSRQCPAGGVLVEKNARLEEYCQPEHHSREHGRKDEHHREQHHHDDDDRKNKAHHHEQHDRDHHRHYSDEGKRRHKEEDHEHRRKKEEHHDHSPRVHVQNSAATQYVAEKMNLYADVVVVEPSKERTSVKVEQNTKIEN